MSLLPKARSDLDFVAREDLGNVLDGPVPSYVKTLFEAILKCTRPGASVESWQQICELLQGDQEFVRQLQAFEPEPSDQHRIRDIIYSELEVPSLPTEFMARFSPGCVLLLRWCHALGEDCGCPPPAFPVTEDNLRAAQAEAQEARDERVAAKQKADNEARAVRDAARASKHPASKEAPAPAPAKVGSRLSLKSVLSGEIFTTLEGALPTWTYKDVVDRLRPLLPGTAGSITLLSAPDAEPMERYSATLDSLGLNSEECELHYSALSAEAFVASQLEPKQKPENMDHAGIEYEMRAYMEEARDQMNCVSMRDISEMKALKYPPMAVYWTIEAVAIILQKPTGDWSSLCRMMCEKNLLSDIVTLEVASVPPGALAQLEWYVENEKLAPEMLKKMASCAVSLMNWARAVYRVALLQAQLKARGGDRVT